MRAIQVKHLTINEIRKIEPRVNGILNEAARTKRASWPDYSRFKLQLIPLVGCESENESIQTPEAYNTVIIALCSALKL